MFRRLFFILAPVIAILGIAQPIEKGYYLFPIMPGKQNYLTGNMGELRPGHFHAGLDIKTNFREGLPVYASADGYISRVVVGERGYGKVCYLRHPNGHTSVYAHNKYFAPQLDSIVLAEQYKKQSFAVDMVLDAGQLTYRKGDIIAYSGNSGSSGGPHLHFEIRDSAGNYLNPLSAGFAEIKDTKAPFISKVALRCLHHFSRVNDEFGRFEINLKKLNAAHYVAKDTVFVSQGYPVGLEVNTYDLMDGLNNLQGINYLQLFVDSNEIFNYSLEKFTLEESHAIDTHIDYETLRRKGSWFHKCYVADGNIIKSYLSTNRGHIVLHDTLVNHKVRLVVKDFNGNATDLEFNISARPHQKYYKMPKWKGAMPSKPKMTEQLMENILKLEYFDKPENMNLLSEIYIGSQKVALVPSYTKGKYTTVYLLDLRKHLPDSLKICDFKYDLDFKKMIVPRQNMLANLGQVTLQFNEKSLFDTLYLRMSNKDGKFTFNDYTTLFDETVGIKIDGLSNVEDKRHAGGFADAGRGRLGYAGGKWDGDSTFLYFKAKSAGTYTLAKDVTVPYLKITKKNKKEIWFKASDAGSGIARYECYVDSNWVLMNYDYKKSLFWSEKKDKTIPFKGELLIKVTDQLGNVSVQKSLIK